MLLHLGIICLLGIASIVHFSLSSLVIVAVSSAAIVVQMLAGICIPAVTCLMPKVPAHCALQFALEEALVCGVISVVADPATHIHGWCLILVVGIATDAASEQEAVSVTPER